MNKKLLLFVLLLFYLSAAPSQEEGFYSFDLKYSEAVNAFAERNYAKAAKIARFLMNHHKNRPEGYKIFADVHQKDDLCEQAMSYYQKAMDLHSKFLLRQEQVNLYSDMAGCYLRMNDFDGAIKMLEGAVKWVDVHKIHNFRKKRGESYFSLALIHQLRGEKTASRLYFLKSIQDGFRKKISYLLVAYYYVKNSQKDIAKNNIIYYRKMMKDEDRMASFEHFYRLFVREPSNERYEKIIQRVDYKKVLEAVLLFKGVLSHKDADKNADEPLKDDANEDNANENVSKDVDDVTNEDTSDQKTEEEKLFLRQLFLDEQ